MSAKIKTGIVGFGYMGEIRYRNIMEHPDMELAGICDPNREAEIKAKGAHVFALISASRLGSKQIHVPLLMVMWMP